MVRGGGGEERDGVQRAPDRRPSRHRLRAGPRRPLRAGSFFTAAASTAFLFVPLACGGSGGERAAPGPAEVTADPATAGVPIESVSLADSIPWEDELGGGILHRVVVHRGGVADTVPAIETDERPRVVGDSLVTGFARVDGRVTRGFVYDPARRRVDSVPLPADFAGFLAHAISPDGRWMAYVGKRENGLLSPSVVRWPSGRAVLQSDPVEGYLSDAVNSAVEWNGDRVEIRVRLPVVDPGATPWLAVTGDPESGSFSADTVFVAGA